MEELNNLVREEFPLVEIETVDSLETLAKSVEHNAVHVALIKHRIYCLSIADSF